MLPPDIRPVSVDDHIIEPPHLWQSRLPAHLAERGPRVVELDDGTEAWRYEDQVVQTFRGSTRTLPGYDDEPRGVARFSEMRPGCFDPVARLADMDLDGVWAQVCFPDFARFAGHRFLSSADPLLATACSVAYNDFVLEEWCAADPERLVPLGILPLWDVTDAADEVRRIAARGMKAIAFSENPAALGLPSMWTDHWEPLWDAVDETGLVVCLHIGSSGTLLRSAADAPPSMVLPHVGANSMLACTDWLFTGVLDRHPSIQVAFSEGGAGWVPYLLEQAEKVFSRSHFRAQFRSARPPREVFAEHMTVCFMCDDTALAAMDVIGVGNMTWESDYPHEDGFFPHSRDRLAETLADVSDDDARRIAETNARALFGLL
ncbi:MAG: amidohydrolase [Acidimicrobiales bacterium]|nr:amidohydrolase [Acidimicrobiales bacterium]